MSIAIIGGTGVGQFPLEGEPERVIVSTQWGDAELLRGVLSGKEVYFLARHSGGHKIPPHKVNFRANIGGLAAMGVRAVFATTAVGSLRADWGPGTLVVLDDLIDFCLTRQSRLGDSGHAHHMRSPRRKKPHLCRCFVAWPIGAEIGATVTDIFLCGK